MGESPPGRSQLADIHIATLRGKNTIPRHTIFPPFCRLRTLAQARPHDDDHLSSLLCMCVHSNSTYICTYSN